MNTFNINKLYLISLAVAFLSACGTPAAKPILDAAKQKDTTNFSPGDFVSQEEAEVNAIVPVGRTGEKWEEKKVVLPKGISVTIIASKVDPERGQMIRIGIDAEEGEDLPSDLWITLEDALRAQLVPESSLGVEGDPNRDPHEEELEEEEPVPHEDVHKKKKKEMTYCYRYVKRYLLSIGQVNVYLPGVSAYMAAEELPKHGFEETGRSPASAEEGDVCVYAGGPDGHGHIEVRREGKWWYGYGFKENPIANREFIACFAK